MRRLPYSSSIEVADAGWGPSALTVPGSVGGGADGLPPATPQPASAGDAVPVRDAVGVALDVALPLARDAERPRRHVVRDHGARGRIGPVADRDRGHERGVDGDPHAGADGGPVLAAAVVVGGDRARADVRALADLRVADVGQVR